MRTVSVLLLDLDHRLSSETRHHADELICLHVIGSEVTWSEIMSFDWLRGILAPPLRFGGDGAAQRLCCGCPEHTYVNNNQDSL